MNEPMHFPIFQIIRASAGSGKTHTIQTAYLNLLRQSVPFRSILALTFTNKAAYEMKARILQGLANDAELKEWRYQLLVNYDAFAVGTLDAFYQRLIQEFLHELGLSSYRRIELNWEDRLENLTHTFFGILNKHQSLQKLIITYLHRHIKEGGSWDITRVIRNAIHTNIRRIYHEGIPPLQSTNFSQIIRGQERLYARRKQLLNDLSQQATHILNQLANWGIQAPDFKRSSQNALLRLLSQQARQEPGLDHVLKFLGKPSEQRTFKAALKKSALAKVNNHLSELEDRLQHLIATLQTMALIQYIIQHFMDGALLEAVNMLLSHYKSEQRVLFLADAPHLLENLITLQQLPFVYEKMGVRYQHIILDEFQDTSHRQWKVLLPLVQEALSGMGSVLLVGDPKQAIYAWRGGESRLIEHIEQEARHQRKWPIQTPILHHNWRSSKTIVEFNNRLFEWLQEQIPQISPIYRTHRQQPAKYKGDNGFVRIETFDHSKEEPAKPRILQWMVQEIQRLIDNNVHPGGILVLVRTRQEAEEVAQSLIQAGFPTVTDTSFRMDRLPPIQWMLSLLRLTAYPDDATHYLWEAAVLWHRIDPQTSLQQAFESLQQAHQHIQSSSLHSVPELVHEWATQLQWHQSPDLTPHLLFFEEIIQDILPNTDGTLPNLLEHLSQRLTQLYLPLTDHQNSIRILTIHKAKGLDAEVVFLPFTDWSLNIRGRPTAATAINEMKWVPFKDLAPYIGAAPDELPGFWIPLKYRQHIEHYLPTQFHGMIRQLSENYRLEQINLLYVALTRARFALYIGTSQTSSGRVDSIGKWLIKFVHSEGSPQWGDFTSALQSICRFQQHAASASSKAHVRHIPTLPSPRPSRPGTYSSEQWTDSLQQWHQLELARQSGIHMHRILRKIYSIEDLPEDAEVLHQMLLQPLIAPYFNRRQLQEWEVANEYPLADGGRIHIIDRILWHRQHPKAVVMEFKFTTRPRIPHIRQVQHYLHILRHKGWDATGFLVFPEEVIRI